MVESVEPEQTIPATNVTSRRDFLELLYLGAVLAAYLIAAAYMDYLSGPQERAPFMRALFGNGLLLLFIFPWLRMRKMRELALGKWLPAFAASILLSILLPYVVSHRPSFDAYPLIFFIPLSEELYFRGVLLDHLLANVGRAGAIVLTTLLFALLHLPQGAFLSMLFLGFVLAVVTVKTKKVAWAILLHATWNFAVVCYGNW